VTRRRLPVVALGAVLALAVASCSSSDRAPETSAADAPLRSPTTTAPPPPVLERVALESAVFTGEGDQRLVAVAAGSVVGAGGRLVAVGSTGGRASVWWSTDGVAWQRPALPPEVFAEDAALADVAADPVSGGFVAVGGVAGAAAAWVSPDGEYWTPAVVDPGPAMDIVDSTRLGLIAFGTGAPTGAAGADPVEETVAWQSFSGERWLRAVDDPDLFARPGTERVVAVVDADREVHALVDRQGSGAELWRTTDGLFWALGPGQGGDLLPAAGAGAPAAAAALGSALVVAGTDAKADGVDAAMWLATGAQGFEQVTHDENVFGGDGTQAMTALTQVGERLFVVGTETGDDGDVDAVVWSPELASGVARSGGPELAVPGDQYVVDIAALGSMPVAVGWEEAAGGIDAVVWLVDHAPVQEGTPPGQGEGDGQSAPPPALAWLRVAEQESLVGPGDQRLEAVTALPDGFVAVGSTPDPADPAGGLDGAVWRSVDGREWSLVAPGSFGGQGDQRLLGVAAGPTGLVAVGLDGSSAAAWTSPDGSIWTRAPADEGLFGGPGDQRAEAVTARPDGRGWVVVGSDGQGDGAVWSSVDGTWARVEVEGLGGPGDQLLLDVVAGSSSLVAVGADGPSAVAWASTDASVWSRADLGAGRAAALAGGGSGVVAVGSAPGAGEDAVTWRSADGTAWERREGDDLAGPLNQAAAGVTVGDDVIVAVGATDLGGGGDAAAWTSADAGTWGRSAHDENVFGGDQTQQMADVAAVGGLVVAVGWSGSTPESRDGAVWVADVAGGSARSRL
jgi:hypothetical protein